MTAFDFSLAKNTSIAFNATSDTLNLGSVNAAAMGVSTDASGNLVLTIGTDTITLQGTTTAQVTTSNFTFGSATNRSAWVVGDNASSNLLDGAANAIDMTNNLTNYVAANQQHASHLVSGLGGNDTLTLGNGNNVVSGGQGGDTMTIGTGNNTIYGGDGIADSLDSNDTITIATVGANTIYSNAGNDNLVLSGTAGSAAGTVNTIFLGLGNDTIASTNAHSGSFVVTAGSGDDNVGLLATSTGDATIYGGNGASDSTDGNDTITFGTGAGLVYGNSGNDSITSGATASGKALSIFAGLGDDTMTAGAGVTGATAAIYGNTGADTLNLAAFNGAHTVFGGNGTQDTTDGNDVITLGAGNSSVYGNSGNDSITNASTLAANTSNIFAGLGNDTVNINSADDSTINVSLATGSDILQYDALTGTRQAKVTVSDFVGTEDIIQITLAGGAAADLLYGSGLIIGTNVTNDATHQTGETYLNLSGIATNLNSTNFVISGGTILATNLFGTTAATLTGGTGRDQLIAGSTGDRLISSNTATGGASGDKLVGGAGNDTFVIDGAVFNAFDTVGMTLEGGAGTDILEVSGTTAVSISDADFPTSVTGVETLKLNDVAATIVIGTGAVAAGLATIDSSAVTGTKVISVNASAFNSNLTVTGKGGVDTITIGGGNSNIDASTGNDQITVAVATNLSSGDTITGGDGTDVLGLASAGTASIADSAFTNVLTTETLNLANTGGAATVFSVVLDAEADQAGIVTVGLDLTAAGAGSAGGDYSVIAQGTFDNNLNVTGGGQNDTITGAAGNDSITGAADADSLTGGSGNDTLVGGAGADTITGGTGTDTFQYLIALRDATIANVDTISGFTAGASGDVLDFTDLTNTDLRGTGAQIQLANSTAGAGVGAIGANTGLYVATNTVADFAAATIRTALNTQVVTTSDIFYLLVSNGTDSVLARITESGVNTSVSDVADTVEFVATFTGLNTTASVVAANFVDFV